jgi:Domain of unknown function (DUF4832)/Domain of unknown function (DUF4874)
MKLIRMFIGLIVVSVMAACSQSEQTSGLEPQVTKTYQATNVNFPNPERGFFIQKVGWDRVIHPDWESLPLAEMQQARRDGYSLVRVYYLIPEFKGTVLSQEFLQNLTKNFADARTAGVKLIPLFAYGYPKTDDYASHPELLENQDAPVSDIMRHLDQLKPVVQQNVDVIAMWDAGFIGPWGEWHTSTNGNIGNTTGSETNSNTRQIVTKLLETVPSNRMITLRTPRYKQQLTGQSALTNTQAFTGSAKARLGAKDDCFLASKTNWGTYLPDDDASIKAYKDFLHQDNLFLPQQGETCNSAADAQPYIGCPNALKDLAYLRFSALNINYQETVLQGWRDGGCFDEISRRFGYRFELVSSSIPTSVSKTQNLVMSFNVKNVGFASPYNPRRLELFLRNQATQQVFRITLNSGALTPRNPMYDPRFWQPGTTTKVSINRALPSRLPVGTYDVLLNLPDPSLSLRVRPEYSIRFANVGTWEATTGFNLLLQSVTVNP